MSYAAEDDEDVEEEADEVVPDGVEEVELARINLEHREWQQKLLLDDIRKLSFNNDAGVGLIPEKEGNFWMVDAGRSRLVRHIEMI